MFSPKTTGADEIDDDTGFLFYFYSQLRNTSLPSNLDQALKATDFIIT